MDRGRIKKEADKLEKWLADYLGGFRVPGSGSIQTLKGDVQWNDILIDSKNTEKNTIPLKLADVEKIHGEARISSKEGHLVLTFIQHDEHWAVLPSKYLTDEYFTVRLQAKKQKGISRSFLASNTKKASKADKPLCVEVEFEYPRLGVPKKWAIIELSKYREGY